MTDHASRIMHFADRFILAGIDLADDGDGEVFRSICAAIAFDIDAQVACNPADVNLWPDVCAAIASTLGAVAARNLGADSARRVVLRAINAYVVTTDDDPPAMECVE